MTSRPELTGMVLALLAVAFWAPAPAVAQRTGTLVELHADRFDGRPAERVYTVVSGDRSRRLARSGQPAGLVGQQVRVAPDGIARARSAQRVVATPDPGPRSLLVILVTTPDAPRAAATVDEAREQVFTGAASMNAFFEQQSAGSTSFVGRDRTDGDVYGPVALATPIAGCPTGDLADAADAAAQGAGYDVDAYDHVMYSLPGSQSCDFGGLGEMPGTRTWVNGDLDVRVTAHEIGHNLSANHANAYACVAGGVAVPLSSTCTTSEYGDRYDVMGLYARLMSSYHRWQIGQLPEPRVQRLRVSQEVTMASADVFGGAGPQLLLIPRKEAGRPVTTWLAVETRSTLWPFDLWPSDHTVDGGVTVRLVRARTQVEQTQLIDVRPQTQTTADAALMPGEAVTDPEMGITVRATSSGVGVDMPAFVDDVPPTPPTALRASGDAKGVALVWDAAEDDEALARYEVRRDGTLIGTTTSERFDDTSAGDVDAVTYSVVAVDTSENRTASGTLAFTIPDTTPPGAVTGLTATPAGGVVSLAWGAATDNRGVRHYEVVRDGRLLGTITTLRTSDAPGPGTHRYSVRAVDRAGNTGAVAGVDVVVPVPAGGTGSGTGTGTGATVGGTSPPGATGSAPTGSGTSGTALTVPAGAPVTRPAAPASEVLSWRRRGRVLKVRFRLTGATTASAYFRGRRVATTTGSIMRVRIRARRLGKVRIRIVATGAGGELDTTWRWS